MTVKIDDHEFGVECDWVNRVYETRYQPSEGGYFEVEKIWYKGLDITEMLYNLAPDLYEQIESMANE